MLENSAPVITLDGPSGSGKGVVAYHLAKCFGLHILDSGALYRSIGLAAHCQGVSLELEPALATLASQLDVEFKVTENPAEPIKVCLQGEDVTDKIRTDEAGRDASKVAALPAVREAIKMRQRNFLQLPGLIADGRDMGTIVFPTAEVKIYLTASAEARAARRYKQLKDKGMSVSLHDLFYSIQRRDQRDMNRDIAPLRPAGDAHIVDTTELNINQVCQRMLNIVKQVSRIKSITTL